MTTKIEPKKEGRPTVMTDATLQKLQDAFLRGYTDAEACLYAGIAMATLYTYQENFPEFSEKKKLWKQNLKLHAKNVVIDALKKNDREMAKWYLEHKASDEFNTKTTNDYTSGGKPIPIIQIPAASIIDARSLTIINNSSDKLPEPQEQDVHTDNSNE